MPSNIITINGAENLTIEISDSFMPVLIKWIEYATKTPEEGTQRQPVIGSMIDAMIQERYGPDAEWEHVHVTNYDDGSVVVDSTLRTRAKVTGRPTFPQ